MRFIILFALLFPAIPVTAQDSRTNNPPAVARICGKLQHFEITPIENAKDTRGEKTRDLPMVTLLLYSAKDGTECCAGLSLAAQTTTGHSGSFHFKSRNLLGGNYWVVARTNGKEYKLLVRYDPKLKSEELCSDTFWQLDDAGKFWKTETIVVD